MKKIYLTLSLLMLSLFSFSQTSGLFFSEYAEGSSNNKYLEIYNGTGATVDLSEYAFPNVTNAPAVPGQYEYWNTFPVGASVADGDVYIIAHPSADPFILAEADHTFSFLSNGDDGYCLVIQDGSWVDTNNDQIMQDTEINGFIHVDWIGSWDGDPGTGWDVAGVTNGTQNHTLLRKETVCSGNPNPLASFGVNATDSEWVVLNIDDWTYLGNHTANCQGTGSPTVTVTPDLLTGFVQFVGTPSAEQTFDVSGTNLPGDLDLTSTGDYEISLTSGVGFGTTLNIPQVGGEVTSTPVYVRLNGASEMNPANGLIAVVIIGAVTGDTVDLEGQILDPNPVVFVSEDTLSGFSHFVGTPSDVQTFEVSGNYLTDVVGFYVVNETEIATNPAGPFSNSVTLTPVGGDIAPTLIYLRLNGAAQNYNQTDIVTVSTVGIADQYVYIFGQTLDYIPYPIGAVTGNDADGVADSLGVYIMLEGLVHCIDFDGNEGYSFTIIDNNTDGINVFNFADVSNYVVNEGDMIRVYGQIDQFNGLTEIFADSIDVVVQGMPITNPIVVTALDESTESQWITLENLSFVTPITTFPTGSNNLDVTDGTNVYTLRIDSDTDIPGSNTPAEPFDVTGVGGQYDSSSPYDSGYQLFPCGTGSFVPSSTTGVHSSLLADLVRVFPNPVGDNLHIDFVGLDELDVEIVDAQGRQIQLLKLNESLEIWTSSWSEGIYFVQLWDSEGNTFVQKLIK